MKVNEVVQDEVIQSEARETAHGSGPDVSAPGSTQLIVYTVAIQ